MTDRDDLRELFRPPGVRDYAVVAGAAAVAVYLVFFLNGNAVAGIVLAAIAALGLVLRLTAMPGLFVVACAYLLIAPGGIPGPPPGGSSGHEIRTSHFRLFDLLAVGAVVVYLAAQYRLFGLIARAVPDEAPPGPARPKPPPVRRPGGLIADGEIGQLVVTLAGCVAAGQLLWLALTELEPDFTRPIPLRLASDRYSNRPGGRALMLAAVAAGGVFVGWAVCWYRRLRTLSRDEAGMMLLDTGWRENRRELNRLAKWQAAGRPQPRSGRPKPRTRRTTVGSAVRSVGSVLRLVWRLFLYSVMLFAAVFLIGRFLF